MLPVALGPVSTPKLQLATISRSPTLPQPTNFANLRNKEENEGFEESVYSSLGKKKRFFNLGFNNRWQKILPINILNKLNYSLQNDLNDLGYKINE